MKIEEKLSQMIQVETISEIGKDNSEKFCRFQAKLKELFPSVFGVMEFKSFDGAILLRWSGKDSSRRPLVLMSHQDVVEATGAWKHEPFSGEIADDRVWGRGTVDTKGSLCAIFEACERLISSGFIPEMDVYISSSNNEEISGSGAEMAVDYLEAKGIKPLLVLDEGGMIKAEPLKGAKGRFAMMGTLEKGTCNFRFVAKGKGGHASAPGKNTPLVRLGKFMADIEKHDPFKAKMNDTTLEMFRRLGRHTPGAMGFALRHAKGLSPVLNRLLPKINLLATAMIKTTLAFTTAGGSNGLNVLPEKAYVTGNSRVIHHEDADYTEKKLKEVAAKYDIDVEVIMKHYACPVVDHNGKAFKFVESVVRDVFPDVITCPYAMTGGTDGRHYSRISENVIRFAPLEIDEQQYQSIHGIDENISVSCLENGVLFYQKIIKNLYSN